MSYDVIVVGAGSAGAIVAARLAEDPDCAVLLLEAGPDYPSFAEIPDEIKNGLAGTSQRDLAARRKSEMAQWADVVPPPTLGDPPPESDDPFLAGIGKMFGVAPEPSPESDVVTDVRKIN